MEHTVIIYVSLLEEGTPTIRPTKAIVAGEGLYRLLPTVDYDPEDEVWEFTPGTIVRGIVSHDDRGEELLLAVQ